MEQDFLITNNLLESTYYSIGKENDVPSLARFNVILRGEYNGFERAAKLQTHNKKLGANILSYLGLLVSELGLWIKAKEYHNKALEIHKSLNDRVDTAKLTDRVTAVVVERMQTQDLGRKEGHPR